MCWQVLPMWCSEKIDAEPVSERLDVRNQPSKPEYSQKRFAEDDQKYWLEKCADRYKWQL